jgi:hypothetical protein
VDENVKESENGFREERHGLSGRVGRVEFERIRGQK